MIRQEALAALEKWRRSEMILSGSEQKDSIELTVVSATGLPKSNFRTSNAWVKMVHYGPNQFGGYLRTFDLKTDVSKATQNPVWNKKFLLEISNQTKLLDFELYDRVAGIDTQLCKYRIFCSFVPGVEASLANRSLLYGIDEEVDFPLKFLAGKGKEREPPLLRLRLNWAGRIAKAEALALPTHPPGKMFRPDMTPVPMSPEEKIAAKNPPRPRQGSLPQWGSAGEGSEAVAVHNARNARRPSMPVTSGSLNTSGHSL